MSEAPVLGHRFERMPDRVAEIQDASRAHVHTLDLFAFVARDYLRLERALRRDYPRQLFVALLVSLFAASLILFSSCLVLQKFSRPLEKFSVADRALLDRLAPPC